jgi:hypothetical protein
MKPQLIMAELNGLTQKRLAKSAAWKKQRIVTMIPSGKSIPVKVYMSHKNIIYPPNNGVCHWAAIGTEVGEAYSNAIEQILSHPELGTWEYILTLESDNMPPADGVLKLLERMEENPKFSCIGGLYYTKGYGGVPQIWGDPKDPVLNFRPQMPDINGGLVECNGTGMGFNLWRMKMFRDKKLRKPWFHTQKSNGVATQDLYAWSDFKKHGYRCAIDCSVRVGHYDEVADIIW